jgi:hypothetical protein
MAKSISIKKTDPLTYSLLFLIILAGSLLTSCKKEASDTIVYGALKDLHLVEGLEQSPYFKLNVNGLNAFVYRGFETIDEFEWYGNAGVMTDSPSYRGVSYTNFSITKRADIEITTSDKILEYIVLPTIDQVKLTDEKTLSLKIDGPKKFVVKVRFDQEWQYFIISAEEPESNIPDRNDPGVLFLDPGIHQYGQAWDPFTNGIHTLYVAGGAVVEATLKIKDKKDIKILGRGLFAQAFVKHAEEVEMILEQEWDADWMGVHIGRSENIEIDGIAIINSPGYQLEFARCANVVVKNVKLLGFGEHNNDGMHTYGRDITVEDCFITANDDRVCITGLFDDDCGTGDIMWDGTNELSGTPVENITIRNMVFWGLHNNGGDIMLTWNGEKYCRNVLVENCISISPTNKAFVSSMHGGSAVFENVVIRNSHLYHGNLLSLLVRDQGYQGAGGGAIRGLTLENITLDANKSEIGKFLQGHSEESNIEGVVFRNIKALDGIVTSLDQTNITFNEFVGEISIE